MPDRVIVSRSARGEWVEHSDATYKVVHRRIKRGWSARDAIFGRAK